MRVPLRFGTAAESAPAVVSSTSTFPPSAAWSISCVQYRYRFPCRVQVRYRDEARRIVRNDQRDRAKNRRCTEIDCCSAMRPSINGTNSPSPILRRCEHAAKLGVGRIVLPSHEPSSAIQTGILMRASHARPTSCSTTICSIASSCLCPRLGAVKNFELLIHKLTSGTRINVVSVCQRISPALLFDEIVCSELGVRFRHVPRICPVNIFGAP